MKFFYQYEKDDDTPTVTVGVKKPDATLTEVLEVFERFLLGCGYIFDGHVEINTEAE